MRYSTIRSIAKAALAFTAIATIGACADSSSVAPMVIKSSRVFRPANFSQVGDPIEFTVNNSTGVTKLLGEQVLSMPAGAICDLETSGYGQSYWDQECQPLLGSITITATLFKGPTGEPYVDFQPAMRFAPNKEVMLFLTTGRTDGTKMASIKYCNDLGNCADESLTDASLKPFRIEGTSIMGRRLKHFSGYVVAFEYECPGVATPIGDGNFWCEAENGLQRRSRSGYMVASGEDIKDVIEKGKSDKVDPTRKDQQ